MFILSIFIVAILLIILFLLPGYSYIKYNYDVVDITSKYNSYYYNILHVLRSCNTIEQVEKAYSWGRFILQSKCDFMANDMPIPIMIALYNMRDLNLIDLDIEKTNLNEKILNKN